MMATATVLAQAQVKIADGALEGVYNPATDVRSFQGVPFAAPPVGDLRWREPQPVKPWEGVRRADNFGPRAMQRPVFGDMNFRSGGMSEDCLYLNVWTPGKSNGHDLPVLVYFYGGGFIAGDGSEPRYDGESMASKGIVAVTVNYRLNVFGFFAHPALTAESPHHASGNYGLLDQHAALAWVRRNIAAFGGDPKRVTIAGESAGSFSVCAHMASPLSNGLFAQAIGESGSMVGGSRGPATLAQSERDGVTFAAGLEIGKEPALSALRALTAEQLLAATAKPDAHLRPTVDGYFLPRNPQEIYDAGEQAHVPLLAGVNSAESGYEAVLGKAAPTLENYRQALQRLYPKHADEVFPFYPAMTDAEVMDSAQALACDRFISYGTWRWMELATEKGGRPTYYYVFSRQRPAMRPEMGDAVPGLAGGVIKGPEAGKIKDSVPPPRGAVHSAEIEYALGNLDGNKVYAWTPEDQQVSQTMQGYFVNFIRTGQPNGPGLTDWPDFATGQHLVIDVHSHAVSNDPLKKRYEAWPRFAEDETAH